MSISVSKEDAIAIQAHLKNGLKVWSPEGVELDIHKPFMSANEGIRGLVKYREDKSISDPNIRAACATPYVHFEYTAADGSKKSGTAESCLRPVHNRHAAWLVFIECNTLLGKHQFDYLGPVIQNELGPLMGD